MTANAEAPPTLVTAATDIDYYKSGKSRGGSIGIGCRSRVLNLYQPSAVTPVRQSEQTGLCAHPTAIELEWPRIIKKSYTEWSCVRIGGGMGSRWVVRHEHEEIRSSWSW